MTSSNWLTLTMAAVLLSGGLVIAESKGAESGPTHGSVRQKWQELAKEKLGLTDEQTGKIRASRAVVDVHPLRLQ